jgi:hypothetical protein
MGSRNNFRDIHGLEIKRAILNKKKKKQMVGTTMSL